LKLNSTWELPPWNPPLKKSCKVEAKIIVVDRKGLLNYVLYRFLIYKELVMKMWSKFACLFLCFFAMSCVFKANFLHRKHILQFHNASLLATNFPTSGWPVCSSCGTYHPGKPCRQKGESSKDKKPKEKKKNNEQIAKPRKKVKNGAGREG